MSENKKRSKRNYGYRYLQCTITPAEKKLIKDFARKENYRSISDFMRRIIFDYIRRRENPELFLSRDNESMNPLLMDKLTRNIDQILENQETILQREDSIEEMRQMIITLHKLAEASAYAKEREIIIELLERRTSLSLRQIQAETNIPEDIVFKIISDMSLFKITPTGRFSLR